MVRKVIFTLSLLALFTVTSCQDSCTGIKDPGTGTNPEVRYYYDTTQKKCFVFQYHGEGGNANRHISEAACRCKCIPTDLTACREAGSSAAACNYPLVRGDCALNIKMYYFNINTNKCEQATFGCKITNGNHYQTLEDCKSKCEVHAGGPRCTDPKDQGTACDQNIAAREMWYYNMNTNKCELFLYLGCGGKQNKFSSYVDCTTTCEKNTFTPPDDCKVVKDEGSACGNRQWVARFYYDTTATECRPFFFGQCVAANENNFMTLKDCQDKCHPPGTCQGLPADCNVRNCIYGYRRDANDCPLCECQSDPCSTLQCNANQRCQLLAILVCKYPPCSVKGYCVDYQQICDGSLNSITCSVATAYTQRYTFNPATNVCELQFFHGCAGPNNFLTVSNCEHVCKGTPITSSTVCPDPVCTCANNIGWVRDANNCPISCSCAGTPGTPPTVPASVCTNSMCSAEFTCVQRCNAYPACTSYVPSCVDRQSCAAVPISSFGNCNRAPLAMWYWETGGCRSFQWTGCTPNNLNLFLTQDDCTRACSTTTSGIQCPTYSCAHCPGGTGTPVLSGNCQICQCSSTPTPSAGCTSCNTGCNTGYESYATGNTLANGCPECKCRPSSTTGGTPTPSSNVCGTSCLQTIVCPNGGQPQLYGKDQNQCDVCSCTQGTPVPAPTPSVTTCANMPCFCGQGQTPVRDLDPATGQCRCQCQSTTSSSSCDCSTRIICASGEKGVLGAGSTTAACNCECCKTSCTCVGGGGTMTIDNRGCAICNCLTNPAPTPCTRDPSSCPSDCAYSTTWATPSGATCPRCECQKNPCQLNPPSCPANKRCKPMTLDDCLQNSCPAVAVCAEPSEVCRQPADSGTCSGNTTPLTRYRFDPATHTCVGFVFSGCGGNDNNFVIVSDCMSFCSGV